MTDALKQWIEDKFPTLNAKGMELVEFSIREFCDELKRRWVESSVSPESLDSLLAQEFRVLERELLGDDR